MAPVKAPLEVPKRILSRSVSGRAAQFWAIKGLSPLALVLWIAWANTSLPVPVSPHIMTGRSQAATTLMYSLAFFIFSSTAMISAIVKKAVFRLTSFPELLTGKLE